MTTTEVEAPIHCRHARLIVSQLFPHAYVADVYVSRHHKMLVLEVIARIAFVNPESGVKEIEVVIEWMQSEHCYKLAEARVTAELGAEREPWTHGTVNLWDESWAEK